MAWAFKFRKRENAAETKQKENSRSHGFKAVTW